MGVTPRAPVAPDADEAREWLLRELAEPEYRAAEPNWFDRLSAAVWEWLTGLLDGGTGGPPAIVWVVVILIAIAAIIAAYVIFGPPRANRRSAVTGALFGEDDERGAAEMRRAAEQAAAGADWALATEEMFRAIARGLAERAVLTASPGTTARGFSARAAGYFPDLDAALNDAAAAFDDVRYLDRPGAEASYRLVAELEAGIRSRTPDFAGAEARG